MSNRFRDAQTKITRANEHISDFADARDLFIEARPYTIIEQQHPKSGQWMAVCRRDQSRAFIQDHLVNLRAIAGDALHNIRAVFDYAINTLVDERISAKLCASPTDRERKRIGFPTHDSAKDLHATICAKAQFAGQAVIDILHSIEPCQGGKGHGIWQLDALNNIDKHRLLLAMVVGSDLVASVIPTPVNGLEFLARAGVDERTLKRLERDGGMKISMGFPLIPLKHGEIILGPYATPMNVDMNETFPIDVALNEPHIIDAQSIAVTFKHFVYLAREILDQFERLPNPVP